MIEEYVKEFALLERVFPDKKNEVKRKVLHDALVCFIEWGVDATTVDMIRQQSNMSIGSIYHHFQNKEGILAALFFAAVEDLSHSRQKCLIQAHNAKESVVAVILSYVEWIVAHPNFAEIMFMREFDILHSQYSEKFNKIKAENRKILVNWFSMPQNIKLIQHIPSEFIPPLILGITEHYVRAWLLGQAKYHPDEVKEELVSMTWMSLNSYRISLSST